MYKCVVMAAKKEMINFCHVVPGRLYRKKYTWTLMINKSLQGMLGRQTE